MEVVRHVYATYTLLVSVARKTVVPWRACVGFSSASAALTVAAASCASPSSQSLYDEASPAVSVSLLTAAQRRVRASEIRDAAAASGFTQGYLLAGIADVETQMSHCWSELTWACQGPSSSDCGGGPVVAGAGDGPCTDLQGGLGMFQFDAGTHEQTLAREGARVLSIAGNTSAAVDFVVSMLIRSVYVDGVDDRDEAIEWANQARIDNEHWDAWVRTVTHYYNGCQPTFDCWQERYARYRDGAIRVHDEMGADFWVVEGASGLQFAAQYVDQSFPLASQLFELHPGEEAAGYIELRNTGTVAWEPGVTYLAPTEARDEAGMLAASDWVSQVRVATVRDVIASDETARFELSVRAPSERGVYSQFFGMVHGQTWFADVGGLPDDQLEVRVTVIEPPACPDRASETCDGAAVGADGGVRDDGGMDDGGMIDAGRQAGHPSSGWADATPGAGNAHEEDEDRRGDGCAVASRPAGPSRVLSAIVLALWLLRRRARLLS